MFNVFLASLISLDFQLSFFVLLFLLCMFQENTRKYLRGCYGRQRIYLLLLYEEGREPIGHLTTCIKKTTGLIFINYSDYF